MKKLIILFMLLFLFLAPRVHGLSTTIRYVDPDASGSANGLDWTNAYTNLNAALSAATKDLVSADLVWKLVCRSGSGGDDTTKISTGDGFTVDATRYVWIYGDDFTGTWDDNAYTIFNDDANGEQIDCREEHIVWENIQFHIKQTSTNTRYGLGVYVVDAGNLVTVKNCIFKGECTGTGAAYGIQVNDADANVNIYNTVIYDFNSVSNPSTNSRGINRGNSTSINVWNCTIENCGFGINATATVKNCALFHNIDDFNGSVTGTYNALDQHAAGGTDVDITATWNSTCFTDPSATPPDFSVQDASSPVYNVGTDDPGGAAQDGDDITGFTRTSTWDIGAFEFDDSGGGGQGSTLVTYGGAKAAGKSAGKSAGKQD